ncbi:MAG: pseudouridine synthase [Pseudomonadota bacterium]
MTTLLLNKPFRVLSQFTTDSNKQTLADFIDTPDVYAAGRLDYDSEGLLLLTSDGRLQSRLSNPRFKIEKTYWAQIEMDRAGAERVCEVLVKGVTLKDGPARAQFAEVIASPDVWPRTPPIRHRESVPASWIALKISEGRNRQVRRMTAAAGAPTLRLIRTEIGPFSLNGLAPGAHARVPDRVAWQRLTQREDD